MNINQFLFSEVEEILKSVYKFNTSVLGDIIFNTTVRDYTARQEKACQLVGDTMNNHGKGQLFRALEQLARVEKNIQELIPSQRDHVVHAIFTFVLGTYIMKIFPQYRVDSFEWKLAALFHDVAYPVQIANGMIGKFTDTISEIIQTNRVARIRSNPSDFLKMNHNLSSLDLIQDRLQKWEIGISVPDVYSSMIENGEACHGIYSSLFLLFLMDNIYEKYNPERKKMECMVDGYDWNQALFENEVVSACSAIFLHNLDLGGLEKEINYEKAPLPYLLKLCDVLQDWERPSRDEPEGISAEYYKIERTGSSVIFYMPGNRVKKIDKELSCLQNIPLIPCAG